MHKNRITELLPNDDADHAIPPDTGSVHEGFVYDPYGLHPSSVADWGVGNGMEWSYMFQSPRADPESRLHAERLRDINPDLGRWIEHEPFGYVEGVNLYLSVYPESDKTRLINETNASD